MLQNKPSRSSVTDKMVKTGVFVGLITLDCIYQTAHALQPNEKQVAEAVLLAAGGPATNAAIAFRALGGQARLVGVLGQHPLAAVVRDDLAQHGVELIDLMPETIIPPPFSSIVVNRTTGDRAVISRNAADRPRPKTLPSPTVLNHVDCLLIDGHQMTVGEKLAQPARQRQIPVVVDGGSWKAGFERVLPLATVVIAAANFAPPGVGSEAAAMAYLRSLQIPQVAVTRGERSILYATPTQSGELAVPSIQPVDTLGAGDIFHGAFCAQYGGSPDFLSALMGASQVAAMACQSFGTRQWISQLPAASLWG
ncbi:MAG: PfkB family carbohydrate kinase [Cyanobacteria bacterium P01_F01_bin.56]